MVLVLVVTLVWSILAFLDEVTSEKKSNLKAIVTERWQFPSQMPYSLRRHAHRRRSPRSRPTFARWTHDLAVLRRHARPDEDARADERLFAFAMEPEQAADDDGRPRPLPADQAADLDAAIAKMDAEPPGRRSSARTG